MKVLLVNGSANAKGCTYTALEEVAGALEKNGIAAPHIEAFGLQQGFLTAEALRIFRYLSLQDKM